MQLWSECCVIGIGGDPLGSTFKGQGCQISIWNEIAGGSRPRTQLRKEPPVARPRHDADCSRRLPDLVGEGEGGGEGTGWSENSRMRHDADEGARDQFTDEKVGRSSQYPFEPSPIEQMAGRILAMSINEDVDVAQDHAPSASMWLRKDTELFKSTPGKTPSPATVTRLMRRGEAAPRSRSSVATRESRMRSVNVRPVSRACRLASPSKFSSSLTVVRIQTY